MTNYPTASAIMIMLKISITDISLVFSAVFQLMKLIRIKNMETDAQTSF